ncbi:hypothetical protein BC826DRAFT_982810 [Russula brevipes]|nr:hypothetical protein BC826DRAFT_982810 [Russula brevipes]
MMAYTRFGFTQAMTFLALIAALLASVKAAPSGLQQRGDQFNSKRASNVAPFYIQFEGPFTSLINGESLSRGETLITNLLVEGTGFPPANTWKDVQFQLLNVDTKTATDITAKDLDPGSTSITVPVPPEAEPGTFSITYVFGTDLNGGIPQSFPGESPSFQVV